MINFAPPWVWFRIDIHMAGTEDGWQQPWQITEDPSCVFGPSASTVESKSTALTSTTTINYAWPDQ